MLETIRYNGGIDFIISRLTRHVKGKRGAELSIAALVSIANLCTANNTIAIITTGPIAKDIAQRFHLDRRKTASILDTFSCVFQGIIPYGAQLLVASSLCNATVTNGTTISAANILGSLWYCWFLAAFGILSIFIPFADGICRKDPWNWEYDCAESNVAAKKALLEKEAAEAQQ